MMYNIAFHVLDILMPRQKNGFNPLQYLIITIDNNAFKL